MRERNSCYERLKLPGWAHTYYIDTQTSSGIFLADNKGRSFYWKEKHLQTLWLAYVCVCVCASVSVCMCSGVSSLLTLSTSSSPNHVHINVIYHMMTSYIKENFLVKVEYLASPGQQLYSSSRPASVHHPRKSTGDFCIKIWHGVVSVFQCTN